MKTILIVDDQPGIRLLLKELFEKEGYGTRIAANGKEALQIMQQERLDCALLDMKMPGMTGIEVLKRLKVVCPKLPVIMMSASEDRQLAEQALRLGAQNYFTKPFDIFKVRDAVNLLFET